MFYRGLTFIKYIVWAFGLCVVAWVFLYPTLEDIQENLSVPEGIGASPHEVHGLQLFLEDQNRGRVKVSAAYAFALDQGGKSFELREIKAEITAKTDEKSRISAQKGTYDGVKNLIVLQGGVEFQNAAGYRLLTNEALIDVKKGEIRGDKRVQGTGPFGQIKAGGFEIINSGKKVRLFNKSNLDLKLR